MGNGMNILTIILIVLVVILLALIINVYAHVHRLNRRYRTMMRGSDGTSIEKALTARLRDIEKLQSKQERDHESLMDLREVKTRALTKYGVVKYDAFDDVGGRLSFALALLDDADTGLVLNVLHSKDNCFVYLKEVVKGESYIMLSDEEAEALRIAAGDVSIGFDNKEDEE